MIRLTSIALLSILSAAVAARADLNSEVRDVLGDKLLHRASVGIEVIRLGGNGEAPTPIYKLEAEAPLAPASNLKLATTSAALDRLGPEFKFKTLLLRNGNDLAIVGDGDPSFGDAEFLKKSGWGTTTVFENWAAQLHKLGLNAVHDVLIDDSIFDDNFIHPHWPANQVDKRYVAEVAGLSLNANCVDFTISPTAMGQLVSFQTDPSTRYITVKNTCTTSNENAVGLARLTGTNDILLKGEAPPRGYVPLSITIHDPPLFTGTVFAETLAREGITVSGHVRRDRSLRADQKKWTLIGVNQTAITTALARANKDSMNLYAESLCKRLGAEISHNSGSWENGTAAVGEFLKHAGVPSAEFSLDDGCGLSKQNAISPNAICHILAYNFASPNHQTFIDSLSVAGVDGTLDDRFRGSDLRRRVFGKSGFIEGVSSLSGYLEARNGHWYAFSILMNGIPHLSNSAIKPLQERIVKAIDAEASGR